MNDWLHQKLGERSTQVGLIALVLGLVMLGAAFFAPPERYPNIESAIKELSLWFIAGGFAGVIFPERKG